MGVMSRVMAIFRPVDKAKGNGSSKKAKAAAAEGSATEGVDIKIDVEDTYDYCILSKKHKMTDGPTAAMKAAIEAEVKGVRICLGDAKEAGIRESRNILLFLTTNFTSNKVVLAQMRLAKELNKHVIIIQETSQMNHAPKFSNILAECPADVKDMLGTQDACIDWLHGDQKRCVSAIVKASKQEVKSSNFAKNLGGLVYEDGSQSIPILDVTLVTFAALCGVSLPGAGKRSRRWTITVRIILGICSLLCLSRFFTTEGPAFLDHATLLQIVVDHPALILFLFVSLRLLNSEDIADLVANRISCTPSVKYLRFKTRIATGLATLLTCSLVLWGWTGYLPGFFSPYYLMNSRSTMVVFGLVHGITWLVILPIFFGSLFASLLVIFTVQELSWLGALSSFSHLHSDIGRDGLHAIARGGKELKLTAANFAKFQQSYLGAWEFNKNIQRKAAVPFLVFWFLEFFLMAWSIWSWMQGFDAAPDDERLPRLRSHWNLVARLTFFMGHSLWFGAGGFIVGLLPWGTNFYGFRMRQLCRKLKVKDEKLKAELIAFLKGHDFTVRVWFLWTPLWSLPLYMFILLVNVSGFSADAARLFGAY